ncbi:MULTISPECIES: DUF4913 domain-containing protein [unclassified Nocardia]|uniref:DUF4913 domain-containing protein n=1 Tax=unclassified Nocardia TaxID=2637762 RepID=UPI0033B2D461
MSDQNSGARDIVNGYPNVFDFVNDYLSRVYSRQVTDISDTVWCTEWWRHPEAAVRLHALWQAWEHFRLEGGPGISVWFLDHADPHMAKLFDPRGPFKYCSVRNGHKGMLDRLPLEDQVGADRAQFTDPDVNRTMDKTKPF